MELTVEHVDLARALAKVAHAGRVDQQGRPYIDHVAWVASLGRSFHEQILGWLHDVVEDTWVTLPLVQSLFGRAMRVDVDAISRRGDAEIYLRAYMPRVCEGSDEVLAVKDRDLCHHLLTIDRLRRASPHGVGGVRVR